MDEMDVKEQVAEIAEQPSIVQAEFDYAALASELVPLLREDLKLLLEEMKEPKKPKKQPTESLPSAEDIVKEAIAEYRRVL